MPEPDSLIVKYAIYPAIGIARVGNSPNEYYLAPEYPGQQPDVADGFKDASGRIKRQVARFRIYGLDSSGRAIKEIVPGPDVSISWQVHLANRKGINYQFTNALDLGVRSNPASKRNSTITGEERQNLIIDPGPRTISGRNTSGAAYRFDTGLFVDRRVPLGELRTDEQGRLLVFGGLGKSASLDGSPPDTFANNDGWYDDTSDGPVRATIQVGGDVFEAEPAMVAVCPPNYGQGLYGVVTMYDVVYDTFCRHPNWSFDAPERPSFWEHLYPIFQRLVDTQWVNEGFHFLFGAGSPSELTRPDVLEVLSDPSDASASKRTELFQWFRNPAEQDAQPTQLPPFYGDGFSEHLSAGIAGLSVTSTQYEWLRRWSQGEFDVGTRPVLPESIDAIAIVDQPAALNRSHLEDCLGGPFHPGIELTWTLRAASMWKSPFRLNVLPPDESPQDDFGPVLHPDVAVGPGGMVDTSGPGTLTRWMGVPWQTDEASCLSGYQRGSYISVPSFWAARVPNQVLTQRSHARSNAEGLPSRQQQKHFDFRQSWLRHFGPAYLDRIASMVERWDQVGIVQRHAGDEDASEVWVELEVHASLLFPNDPAYRQLEIAEGAVEREGGMTAPQTAAAQVARQREQTPEAQQAEVLERDQM